MPTGGGRGINRERVPDPAEIVSRGDLAAALTALRERAGLAVRDLAREIDSPAATVGGYLSGRHLPTAAQFGGLPQDAARVRRQRSRRRRGLGARRSPGSAGSAAHRSAADVGPYRGLDSFQPEDADWFFGREAQTRELVDCVDRPRPGRDPDDRRRRAVRVREVVAGPSRPDPRARQLLVAADAGRAAAGVAGRRRAPGGDLGAVAGRRPVRGAVHRLSGRGRADSRSWPNWAHWPPCQNRAGSEPGTAGRPVW